MRALLRNKHAFYAAKYLGKEPIIDENGYDTGEKKLIYSEPVKLYGNISPAKGTTETYQFGTALDYERVITLDNPCADIDEYSRLWLDRTPDDGAYDHTVKRAARSLNNLALAVKRVNVR